MDDTVMKEWICQEIPALTVNRKIVSTMLRKKKELVRCKDCKHRGNKICPFYRIYQGEKYDDWFCADGGM